MTKYALMLALAASSVVFANETATEAATEDAAEETEKKEETCESSSK